MTARFSVIERKRAVVDAGL